METAIRELTEAINQMNSGIDWASAISAVCSVVSLIAIVVLLVERKEKQRPYLQISFELVKSSLVCLVIASRKFCLPTSPLRRTLNGYKYWLLFRNPNGLTTPEFLSAISPSTAKWRHSYAEDRESVSFSARVF